MRRRRTGATLGLLLALAAADPAVARTAAGEVTGPTAAPPASTSPEEAPPVSSPSADDDAGETSIPTEEVRVEAKRGGTPDPPLGLVSTILRPEDVPGRPAMLTDALAQMAGVAQNGQAGLLRPISIRGLSKQRVLTLVEGVRLTTERRAGAATSFLDPLLTGSLDVLRGPASAAFGSDALGGVVQVFLPDRPQTRVEVGYSTQGDETVTAARHGEENWSVGIAHRQAGDAEDPRGARLFSRFRRTTATVSRRWRGEKRDYGLIWIPSYTSDIGKAASDFPGRATLYPRERHQLVRLSVTGNANPWAGSVYVHGQDLHTQVRETGSVSDVAAESFDFGGAWSRTYLDAASEGALSLRLGVDVFGRSGVDVNEREIFSDPNAPQPVMEMQTLSGGRSLESAGVARLGGRAGRLSWEAGTRLTWMEQSNRGAAGVTQTAWNGFGGVEIPLTSRARIGANVGTGFRFPTLTERFFSGTTGRGVVMGNPGLSSERALNGEIHLGWVGRHLALSGSVFRNEIENFIERVEPSPGMLTFVNLTSGTIRGTEIEGTAHAARGILLRFGGHVIDGHSSSGAPLADVPADALFFQMERRRARWRGTARLEARRSKDDPGPGEGVTPSAALLSGSFGFRASPQLWLTFTFSNLLDETYLASADDRAPFAPGRSAGVMLRWSPGG